MKINIKTLDHIQLTIPKASEELAKKFYTGILGLAEIDKPEVLKSSGGVWYKAGQIELHLGIDENHTTAKRKAHPAFVVEGLNRIKIHLLQNGVDIKEEIQIPGRKRFSFYDPFGNRIEFMEFEE
jgi:catechol 2,3-dioxygenase-like lactoylglutathione lyase family enzyme